MKSILEKKPSAKKEVDAQRILNYLHMISAEKQITKILDDKPLPAKKSV